MPLRAFLFMAMCFCAVCARAQQASRPGEVQVEMKNISYHFTDSIYVHIHQPQGKLIPSKSGEMVIFDDRSSFTLAIAAGQISISTDALTHVLTVRGRPLRMCPRAAKSQGWFRHADSAGSVAFSFVNLRVLRGKGL